MTENAPIPALARPAPEAAEIDPAFGSGESFWSVVVRRTRYCAAIAASAAIFLYLAWRFLAPPPEHAGVSLMAWSTGGELVAAAVVAALLILTILVSMFLCHPDAPHIGVFCAFLGLGGIAIRGGNIHALVYDGQIGALLGRTPTLASFHKLLALECVQWAVLIIIAEVATRVFYDRIFANMHWIHRGGLSKRSTEKLEPQGCNAVGFLGMLAVKTGARKSYRVLQNLTALLATVVVGAIMLQVFMQSEAKGQVLFALYISFAVAGAAGRWAAPLCDPWALMLAVPLAAAVGYLSASTKMIYPGETVSAMARALPIDYVCAGVPAVILGYYFAFRIQFQHALEPE